MDISLGRECIEAAYLKEKRSSCHKESWVQGMVIYHPVPSQSEGDLFALLSTAPFQDRTIHVEYNEILKQARARKGKSDDIKT